MSSEEVTSDPRWRALHGQGLACTCGQRHNALFAIGFLRPPGWTGRPEREPDRALRMDGDFLSENYCVIQGRYFAMRMSMPLPVRGAPPPAVLLSVWAAVERVSFEHLRTARPQGMPSESDPQDPARLLTRIGGYPDTNGLMGRAFAQPDGPPLLVLERLQPGSFGQHPLISDHREGATLDRLFELYKANGHDMRQT